MFGKRTVVAMWQGQTGSREAISTRWTVGEMEASTDVGYALEIESTGLHVLDVAHKGKRK